VLAGARVGLSVRQPSDLVIVLLQDAGGRIDLVLPVSGTLDNSPFSYGALTWQVVTDVPARIVTAPFRALAALEALFAERLGKGALATPLAVKGDRCWPRPVKAA